VQRATAQSKTGISRDYGVAEAPPDFQAGWSDCTYFFSLKSKGQVKLLQVSSEFETSAQMQRGLSR
jgi:hypothetical protein